MEFTVLKTKVTLSPVFFMVLTVFFLLDREGLAVPAILLSAMHEICHFFALLCVKSRPLSVSLSLFGIEMALPRNLSTGKKVFVLSAGFALNFAAGSVLILNGYSLYGYISLFIGIFTAFPLPSTDGGGILTALAEEFSPENSDRIIKSISIVLSFLVAFLLCAAGFYTKNAFLSIPITYILIMALKKSS